VAEKVKKIRSTDVSVIAVELPKTTKDLLIISCVLGAGKEKALWELTSHWIGNRGGDCQTVNECRRKRTAVDGQRELSRRQVQRQMTYPMNRCDRPADQERVALAGPPSSAAARGSINVTGQ
jgi:hypothetical protein